MFKLICRLIQVILFNFQATEEVEEAEAVAVLIEEVDLVAIVEVSEADAVVGIAAVVADLVAEVVRNIFMF